MVFEKGLKVDNSKLDNIVRKLSKKHNFPNEEDYKLGKGYPGDIK